VGYLLASRTENVVIEKRVQPGSPVRVVIGDIARRIREAEAEIRTWPEWKETPEDYELRAIRIPRLYLEALWLHSPRGLGDYVLPYAAFEGELKEGQRRSLDFFLRAATRLARQTPPVPRA
jgi:hypothetical protein